MTLRKSLHKLSPKHVRKNKRKPNVSLWISALSEQQVVELYRQCSELSRLISPRVENALQQYARRELIHSATDDETHEADNEAPPSRFGTIRKKPGKKLLEGLKILGSSGTQKGKEKRGSSIGDTFARFKSIIKSTLGSDKSTDDTDTAVTDESSAASPFKSTHMPSHDTQGAANYTNPPTFDGREHNARSKKAE